jgi:hypothetical protein
MAYQFDPSLSQTDVFIAKMATNLPMIASEFRNGEFCDAYQVSEGREVLICGTSTDVFGDGEVVTEVICRKS